MWLRCKSCLTRSCDSSRPPFRVRPGDASPPFLYCPTNLALSNIVHPLAEIILETNRVFGHNGCRHMVRVADAHKNHRGAPSSLPPVSHSSLAQPHSQPHPSRHTVSPTEAVDVWERTGDGRHDRSRRHQFGSAPLALAESPETGTPS